jgi:hypothetical protein
MRGLGALAAGLQQERIEGLGVLSQVFVGVGHGVQLSETEASPDSELRMATPSRLSW